jgi:hypothetical protein
MAKWPAALRLPARSIGSGNLPGKEGVTRDGAAKPQSVPIGTFKDIASRPFILIERRMRNATHDNFSAMSHIHF